MNCSECNFFFPVPADPEFVSSAFIQEDQKNNPTGEDDKIYFFFTEVAKEYDLYTKVKVPRVARVCKVGARICCLFFSHVVFSSLGFFLFRVSTLWLKYSLLCGQLCAHSYTTLSLSLISGAWRPYRDAGQHSLRPNWCVRIEGVVSALTFWPMSLPNSTSQETPAAHTSTVSSPRSGEWASHSIPSYLV